MKTIFLACGVLWSITTNAQPVELVPDQSIPIPKVSFDASDELVVHASTASSESDFDFLVGDWLLYNRKLKARLEANNEWTEFKSKVKMRKILGGHGNMDELIDTHGEKSYEGIAVRLFDVKTKLWRIYWADINSSVFDPPMVGSFENNVGHFFCKDVYKGKPILVLFRWDKRNPDLPVWSQAFSPDKGKTWEWNAMNVSERLK